MCDEAFTKTNHIDSSWTENEGVKLHLFIKIIQFKYIKSSVGDYMMIDDSLNQNQFISDIDIWSCEFLVILVGLKYIT